jgi:hypothetical protein
MEESKLYTARVQVAQAMEQGLPWHEAAKREKKVSQPRGEPEWQEGAGGLLLLAAANATALLSQLEEALPMKQQISCVSRFSPHQLFPPQRSLLLTLLFLPAVGLRRFWDLCSYTGRELALLTGRAYPYSSFSHVGAFVPLTVDRQGRVLRDVAPAQFVLARCGSAIASSPPAMHMLPGSASNRFFGYQVASSGAMRPSMSTCIISTTGDSLVTYSLSVSGSTRCTRGFLMVDFSFYMRPLHLLAETLV